MTIKRFGWGGRFLTIRGTLAASDLHKTDVSAKDSDNEQSAEQLARAPEPPENVQETAISVG